MTCEIVRKAVLEGSTRDFAGLAPHLQTCPDCAALAAAAQSGETELRRHVEDFVTTTSTLDAQWANALDAAGPRPWRWNRLHTLVLGAAVVAVVAAAVIPSLTPPPPADPTPTANLAMPVALTEAHEQMELFDGIDVTDLDVDGLERADEDVAMAKVLRRKAEALMNAETALAAAADGAEPVWRVRALQDLGDVYLGMADALEGFPHPSYLTDEQSEVYQRGLNAKAAVQLDKAHSVWQLALEAAGDAQLPTGTLDERLERIEPRLVPAEPPPEATEQRQEIADLYRHLRMRSEACGDALDPASRKELDKVLKAAQDATDDQNVEAYGDILVVLEAYDAGLDEACP